MNNTIFIRHAKKQYSNGKSNIYSHDPPLLKTSYQEAEATFIKLLELYGVPKCVISSPFLRAKQTATVAWNVIKKTCNIEIPCYLDNRVGEFLQTPSIDGHKLRNETLNNNPFYNENVCSLRSRVKYFLQESNIDNSWIITHGMVIRTVSNLMNRDIYPEELHGIRITQNKVEEI